LLLKICAIHEQSRATYGVPRVHAVLAAAGIRVGKKRVERLMRSRGLVAWQKRRFRRTTDSRHALPLAPNVLDRQFATSTPNAAWVTDVTYVATDEGWMYLAVLVDLYSRRVVGWAASAVNDRALVLAALERALRTRHPRPGLVHHSDRGSPYASDEYRKVLDKHGIVASMSCAGDCYDNAVAESFFATLRAAPHLSAYPRASFLTRQCDQQRTASARFISVDAFPLISTLLHVSEIVTAGRACATIVSHPHKLIALRRSPIAGEHCLRDVIARRLDSHREHASR